MSVISMMNKIFTKKQKTKMFLFVFLMVIEASVELLSISLVLPLMNVILDADKIKQNEFVRTLCDVFHISSTKGLVIGIIVLLCMVYALKCAYLIWFNYVQNQFVSSEQRKMATGILKRYLNKPYTFFMFADTGELMRILGSDVGNVFLLLKSVMTLFSETLVLCAIVIFLVVVDWKMSLIMLCVLGVVLIIIAFVFKPLCNEQGQIKLHCMSSMNKCQIQTFTGIKEVKVMQKQDFFANAYDNMGQLLQKATVKSEMYSIIPRQLIETVMLVGVMSYLVVEVAIGVDIQSMIATVGAFAFAATRLIPCAARISSGLNYIAGYKPSLQAIVKSMERDLNSEEEFTEDISKTEKLQVTDSIQFKDIVYAYPHTDKMVLNHVNFEVKVGESVGIIGESGAGKSTMVDIMLGLLNPQYGEVAVDGVSIYDNYRGWLSNVGYIPQVINLNDGSIRENVAFGIEAELINEDRIRRAIEDAQLDSFVSSLPEGLDTQIGERGVRISGGQRQRIGIARALYAEPEVLVFDEATSALDTDTEKALMDAVERLHGRKTMIIIAHRNETLNGCDKIYRVESGNVSIVR